ncbi:hypothetical protein BVI1335_1940016 [Burkholderia vietnamiensis]|nr:hypothetical protein BVI1335_1940016 [Burkholderia vietnamiensis]
MCGASRRRWRARMRRWIQGSGMPASGRVRPGAQSERSRGSHRPGHADQARVRTGLFGERRMLQRGPASVTCMHNARHAHAANRPRRKNPLT